MTTTQMAAKRFKPQPNKAQNQVSNQKNNQQKGDNSLETWKEIFNENNTSQLSKKTQSKKPLQQQQLPQQQQQQQQPQYNNISVISSVNTQSKQQQKGATLKKGGEMVMQPKANQRYNAQNAGNMMPSYQQGNLNINQPYQSLQMPQQFQSIQMPLPQQQQQPMMMYPNQMQGYQSIQQGFPQYPNQQKASMSPQQRKDYPMPKNKQIDQNPQVVPRANSSGPHSKIRDFVEYNPYTLKDYKQLTRVAVVMGPSGANLGTKEWEEKKKKMKKMEMYSNKISQTHLGLKAIKKDTPQDEIEKSVKRKMEESIRYKTQEYSKLIHPTKVNKGIMDYYYKDLGIINEEEEKKINTLMNPKLIDTTLNNNNNNKSTIEPINNSMMSKEKNDMSINNNIDLSKDSLAIHKSLPINQTGSQQDAENIESLLKQQESYKTKINDIKESLLN